MDGEFRRITSQNIAMLSAIYRDYAGSGLKEEMVLRRSSGYPAWALFKRGEPIAFFYCFHFAPDVLELANIFIAEKHRSKGLGGRLVEQLYNDMEEPFRHVIAVNSTLNSSRGAKGDPRNFYLRSGFGVIAETQHSVIYWGTKDGAAQAG